MKTNDQPEPTVFVIFGGAGDLTWRKLVPALFDLSQDRSMPADFSIIAVDRVDMSDEKLRRRLHDGVKKFSRQGMAKAGEWGEFARHIHYQQGDFKKLQTYTALGEQCAKLEKQWGAKAHRIFYMATPPSMFGEIPKYLGKAGLARDREWARIVVEKPIGYDLESARALNATLAANFDESQIFRIDHYLGKETVQNILAFRFANPLFEPIWNRRYVECVTITAVEAVGVEHRGGYYDHAGALRDMVQNHLMQLLCLVAMEPMVSFEADEIRNKKVDVLHAVRPIHRDAVHQCVVRGQYGNGWVGGKKVPGYREENGVLPDSQTETFVALRLFVDNWRWQGVPFYLRTGKRLTRQTSEISIQFRGVPHQSFPAESTLDWQSSRLVMSIQPNEGIVLRFQAKHPGPKMHLRSVEMQFNYEDAFAVRSPEAYETLLWDIMKNDATLFMRADQVEAAWRLLMPVLEVWAAAPPSDFPNYAAGHLGAGGRPGPACPRTQLAVADRISAALGSAMPLHLYLIRHGETEWSRSHQHTGRTDIPLTEQGEQDVRKLGARLCATKFNRVFTSPMQRARRTCTLTVVTPVAEIEPDLSEWDYGDYEGQCTVDIRKKRPDWNIFRDGCPRGEMPAQVSDRADRLIAHLRTLDGKVALFSHGQFGCVLAARWIGLPVIEGPHFVLGTASLSVLGYDPDHPKVPVIALWNAFSHEMLELLPHPPLGDSSPSG